MNETIQMYSYYLIVEDNSHFKEDITKRISQFAIDLAELDEGPYLFETKGERLTELIDICNEYCVNMKMEFWKIDEDRIQTQAGVADIGDEECIYILSSEIYSYISFNYRGWSVFGHSVEREHLPSLAGQIGDTVECRVFPIKTL